MGKLKTRKTLEKRLRITTTGKLLKKQNNTGHLKVKWSANRKNRKKNPDIQSNSGHIKVFRRLLGK